MEVGDVIYCESICVCVRGEVKEKALEDKVLRMKRRQWNMASAYDPFRAGAGGAHTQCRRRRPLS